MGWKTAYRSFYYANAEQPEDIHLDPKTTALLVIDVQFTYLEDKDTAQETARTGRSFPSSSPRATKSSS